MSREVVFNSNNLFTSGGFGLQSVEWQSAALRSFGYYVPGLDGVQTQLASPTDRDPLELVLAGVVNGSCRTLRSNVLKGGATFYQLRLSDMDAGYYYNARGLYVNETEDIEDGDLRRVTLGFLVSPGCLLGPAVTDTSSPVANAGDLPCPAVWTITASGNFTLACGGITAVWTGGAGTIVINSGTFEVTKNGAAAPQYLNGGYPRLLPGNNTVTLSAGSFSCTFNPRYA